jgi:tRNA/rRNA methyltransferase
MGFERLRCAAARHPNWKIHPDAIARASQALGVLDGATSYPSLDPALADGHFVIAVSAEIRDFGPDMTSVSEAAQIAVQRLRSQACLRVIWLFGSERYGLSRQQAARAHLLACIPGQPEYHSLNLAQAVLLVAWETRKAMLAAEAIDAGRCVPGGTPALAPLNTSGLNPWRASPPHGEPANAESFEAMIQHLEAAALRVGFLDPKHPKMLLPRLRRMLMRCELRKEEVDLLRGLLSAVEQPRCRGASNEPRGGKC